MIDHRHRFHVWQANTDLIADLDDPNAMRIVAISRVLLKTQDGVALLRPSAALARRVIPVQRRPQNVARIGIQANQLRTVGPPADKLMMVHRIDFERRVNDPGRQFVLGSAAAGGNDRADRSKRRRRKNVSQFEHRYCSRHLSAIIVLMSGVRAGLYR